MREYYVGNTGETMSVYLTNAIGLPITGLTNTTAGLSCGVIRERSAYTGFSLVNVNPTDNWTSGGFCAVDNNLAPGIYRFDAPNICFSTGSNWFTILFTGSTIYSPPFTVLLENPDTVATDILDSINGVETGYTLRQAMRLILSAVAGKVTGAETNTIVFRDVTDSKSRIIANVTPTGNRTSLTYDVS